MNKYITSIATIVAVVGVAVLMSANTALATIDENFGFDTDFDLNTEIEIDFDDANTVVVSETVVTECNLTASQNSVIAGESVTLDWDTTGFTTITINGESVSGENGSVTIDNILEDQIFTLVATNDSGSHCEATVNVGCEYPEVVVEEEEEEEEENTYTEEPTAPTCPIAPKDGRTIVRLDQYGRKLFDDVDLVHAQSDLVSTAIPAGTYDVTLVSWDGYLDRVHANQANESYFVILDLEDGSTVNTNSLSDLADYVVEDTNEETVNTDLVISSTITSVRAMHANYPGSGTNSLAPICVAFDEVEEEVEPPMPSCPLTAKDGRIIVDFSSDHNQKIFSDWGDSLTRTDWVSTNIPAGTYDITLASWDGYLDRINNIQDRESYYAALRFADNAIVNTNAISDLQDFVVEATNVETVNQGFVLNAPITSIRAEHAFAGESGANSLAPTCIAFDPVVIEDPKPICELFTATPGTLPNGGGDVTLTWEVTNATNVSISPTLGTVALTGSDVVSVTDSTTYTLTATDADGDEVTCDAPVVVADPEVFTCGNNVNFSISDSSIRRGTEVTLDWSTTDVDTVSISGINATDLSGSETVSPSSDTTYVLTATKGNDSIECPVSVDVTTGGGGGGSRSPRCELEISDTKISLGDEITLTWDTSNATEITLTDDLGTVLVTTDDKLSSDKDSLFDSSITIKPTRSTSYTLLAERGSKDRECTVEVSMDDVVVIETRDQEPLVAGISLSQVPYTGFEAGPFMTIMFYLLLVAWAAYITFLIVSKKKSAHR